jgi:hypothetical protein
MIGGVSRLRSVLVWLPLVFLAAGVSGAAVLGMAEGRVTLSVVQVIRATTASRTVHYSYVSVDLSANPNLRSRSSATGGLVFATGNGWFDMLSRSVGYSSSDGGPEVRVVETTATEQRSVDGKAYTEFGIGTPGFPVWIRLPADLDDQRGLVGGLNDLDGSALGLLGAPARDLTLVGEGVSVLGGAPEHGYDVELTNPENACAAGIPVDRSGRSTATTEIWVDQQERLRQVRTEMTFQVSPTPGFTDGLPSRAVSGSGTEVTTLQFRSFDRPVHVVAPPARLLRQSLGGSVGVATFGCDTKAQRR